MSVPPTMNALLAQISDSPVSNEPKLFLLCAAVIAIFGLVCSVAQIVVIKRLVQLKTEAERQTSLLRKVARDFEIVLHGGEPAAQKQSVSANSDYRKSASYGTF